MSDVNPEIIARIMEQESDRMKRAKALKEEILAPKVPTIALAAGCKRFSEVFGWEPDSMPDIPVRVFSVDDWDDYAKPMIPSANENWVWNKLATENFALAMYCNDTTLLYGYQGTGKSDLAREYCARVGMPMWRMSCHEETREQHFVGAPSVQYDDDGKMHIKQDPTLLTDSLRYGGMFVEDEAFRHSSALVLQSLREKNTRRLVLPDAPGMDQNDRILEGDKDRWRYVLTDNTQGTGDSSGMFQAQIQDASTLDRITAAIEIDYLPPSQEIGILERAYPDIDTAVMRHMCDVAKLVRNSFKEGTLQLTMSVRGLLSWAEKLSILGSPDAAFKVSFYSKVPVDNRVAVADIYHQVFAVKII